MKIMKNIKDSFKLFRFNIRRIVAFELVLQVISAALLIFGYAGDGQKVPTTHQITSVVGTALGLTGGNVAIAVLFALISNHIYLVFAKYFNEDCSTHIDPPAVGILVGSLLANLLF